MDGFPFWMRDFHGCSIKIIIMDGIPWKKHRLWRRAWMATMAASPRCGIVSHFTVGFSACSSELWRPWLMRGGHVKRVTGPLMNYYMNYLDLWYIYSSWTSDYMGVYSSWILYSPTYKWGHHLGCKKADYLIITKREWEKQEYYEHNDRNSSSTEMFWVIKPHMGWYGFASYMEELCRMI